MSLFQTPEHFFDEQGALEAAVKALVDAMIPPFFLDNGLIKQRPLVDDQIINFEIHKLNPEPREYSRMLIFVVRRAETGSNSIFQCKLLGRNRSGRWLLLFDGLNELSEILEIFEAQFQF